MRSQEDVTIDVSWDPVFDPILTEYAVHTSRQATGPWTLLKTVPKESVKTTWTIGNSEGLWFSSVTAREAGSESEHSEPIEAVVRRVITETSSDAIAWTAEKDRLVAFTQPTTNKIFPPVGVRLSGSNRVYRYKFPNVPDSDPAEIPQIPVQAGMYMVWDPPNPSSGLGFNSVDGTTSISWDDRPDYVRYRIHLGASLGIYTSSVDVGKISKHSVGGLSPGNSYHVKVVGYTASNAEVTVMETGPEDSITNPRPMVARTTQTLSSLEPFTRKLPNRIHWKVWRKQDTGEEWDEQGTVMHPACSFKLPQHGTYAVTAHELFLSSEKSEPITFLQSTPSAPTGIRIRALPEEPDFPMEEDPDEFREPIDLP